MKGRTFFLTLIFGSACAFTALAAPNPTGFYVGGSVGQSNVRTSTEPISTPDSLEQNDTAWKLLVGLRPIAPIAAELAYLDFGHLTAARNLGPTTLHASAQQRAATLSALIFAPLPLPVLDLYARAGVARLQDSGSLSLLCNPPYFCTRNIPLYLNFDDNNIDFLYGAGVQLKLSALAIRFEYERINDSRGDPDLLSAGLIWTF